MGEFARSKDEFESLGVQLVALSCDNATDHAEWCKDIAAFSGIAVKFAIIDDSDRTLATQFRMLDPDEKDEAKLPVTVRSVYFIGPDNKVRATLCYPPAVGRNIPELIRVVKALQLADAYPIATPVNWSPGERVMIQPSLSDAEASSRFAEFTRHDVPSGKGYIRMTADPSTATGTGGSASAAASSASSV
jgi:1-Cys peroxiredoxin 6